ncbi:DNA translocase FtsK [Aliiroseovarius subalbicans]|uniref:DNA translocase FtsK n=1 Tax=Aliiroseovarius subalbicans TaxID=2925840 RepID=UPI001F5922B5|nr:DNA translocase FtsK [Aliiroseovarius subalbicans]MCI2400193.1 DNA translocase FtsK 4TM domain-containing protein [Aliiroseovarius subalbicans]
MAYQARQRDPIFDATTQAVIERRSKELLGVGLIVLGILVALVVGSYAPEDPGWFSATEAPVQNLLGRLGAVIASPLAIIVGFGAWALAAALVAWGVRFVLHAGEERAVQRLVFAPVAVALVSIYASTMVPGAGWTHSFGLGGLFGDTVLGAVLGVLPVDPSFGLKVLSVLVGFAALAMLTYVLGFTWAELNRVSRFLMGGVVLAYDFTLRLLGKSARGAALAGVAGVAGAARGAQGMRARAAERRASRAEAAHPLVEDDDTFSAPPPLAANRVLRAEPPMEAPDHNAAVGLPMAPLTPVVEDPKPSLLSRIALMKRQPDPEPELVEQPVFSGELPEGAGEEDRIKAKIAQALKHRARAVPTMTASRAEPAMTRRRGPDPMILNTAIPPQPVLEEPNIFAEDPVEDELVIEPVEYAAPAAQVFTPSPKPAVPESKRVVQHAPRKAVAQSTKAKAEAQPSLKFDDNRAEYELPPLNLLTNPVAIERHHLSDDALEENARMLEVVLDDYGVKGEIVSVRPGPVVTMYELEPAPGLKASRVIGLADDIARSMSALSARVSTVPGRSVIGIELPNVNREKVVLREILSARDFGDGNMKLPLALGKDIGGDPIVANLSKMPHLLIAGTTGSGKSVAINTMILSLLYKLTPEECRLIMIDPKMLELSVYDGIPHLLSPVVTDPKKAVVALKWVVGEMEERYRKMSKMGVRNIDGYNSRVADALAKDEMFSRTVQTGFDEDTGEPIFETEESQPVKLPYIVVVVDEMADLMMVAGKEIEACIQRLAQMARASGIHLIMATQRPSVDVITGTIKANFPTRISFQVTSKIDSRTILGEQGAEQLLGMGDMLYMAGGARITRVHGPFVSDEEVEEIVTYLKSYGPPEYVGGVVDGVDDDKSSDIDAVLGLGGNTDGEDALYDQAVAIVIKDRKCSTSYIQRKLAIGYNKAARLVEQMEDQGLVSASNHVGKRDILVPEQQ